MPLYRRPGSPFWWVRVGRSTRKSTGTADRRRAEEFERVLADRLWRAKKLGERGAVSWAEVAARYLTDSARPRKRERQLLEWLKPRIGEEAVTDVAHPDALEELRKDALSEGWTPSTVDRLMTCVRAVLRRCVAWRYLESAPHVPMYRPATPEPRWLTRAQFEKLTRELPEALSLAARIAVLTGLRHSAMLGLTWDRIDLAARTAWIPAGQMKAGRRLGIPLSMEAVRVLRRLRKLHPTGQHVFQWRKRPLKNCNTRAFREAVERCGFSPFRWHDLRHTFASWAVQSGVALPELMQLGGWSTYSMALRYSHLAPQHLAAAAEKVAHGAHTAKRRSVPRGTKKRGNSGG